MTKLTSLLTADCSSMTCIPQVQMMPQTPTSRPRPAIPTLKLPDLAQIREVCCTVKPLSFMIMSLLHAAQSFHGKDISFRAA